jgi:hypothetical protein
MTNVFAFPKTTENAHFDRFLKENNEDPELPLLVYDHLCTLLDTTKHELAAVTDQTYRDIEAAVNGLMESAETQGVITNPNRLQNRRVVHGGK